MRLVDGSRLPVRGLLSEGVRNGRLRWTETGAGESCPVTPVRGISFTVGRGESVGVVGESGAGKSAAARGIIGLLPPSARIGGSVRYRGEELVGAAEADARRQEVVALAEDVRADDRPAAQVLQALADHAVAGAEVEDGTGDRHLVELHGGTISVESLGEGLGATFTIQLPTAAGISVRGGRFRAPIVLQGAAVT